MAFPFQLIPFVVDYAPTGSREICNPPPMDTDEDWVVLVAPSRMKDLKTVLLLDEWKECCDATYEEAKKIDATFCAYRKGEINLIFTQTDLMYERWKFATKLCKFLNLKDKAQRIGVFTMVKVNDLGKQLW